MPAAGHIAWTYKDYSLAEGPKEDISKWLRMGTFLNWFDRRREDKALGIKIKNWGQPPGGSAASRTMDAEAGVPPIRRASVVNK